MNRRAVFMVGIVLLCPPVGILFAADNQPHIGYLYPAGGRQGHDVLITVGGQFLQKPTDVYISGQGVTGQIVQYYRPITNLQKEQRQWITDRLKEARDNLLAVPEKTKPNDAASADPNAVRTGAAKKNVLPANQRVPEHPLLFELESQSLRQLAHIQNMLLRPRSKIQPNRQIAETVLIKLTIEKNAAPGQRRLRIRTASGLTNPMVVEVGQFAEYMEMEPNDRQAYPAKIPGLTDELPREKAITLPVVLNGQILPGDIDRFRFRAEAGQQIVIQTHARSLIPYLADAVPGWFQAVISVCDDQQKELAFADDYRFHPDPVLLFKVPKTAEYELVIRDSIYRGREDFVYRISIGEVPFITGIFPLGAKVGQNVSAALEGWNLPAQQAALDTAEAGPSVRSLRIGDSIVSNDIPYAVDTLPEAVESASNDSIEKAQPVQIPVIVNGRIESAQDVDIYSFRGKKDDAIDVEVVARKLNSPLDSLVRLTDASGKTIAWNDDYSVRTTDYLFKDAAGLQTHQADSFLTAKLPADGNYCVHLSDAQKHGGPAYAYRLKITPASPDFALWTVPSSLTAPAGASVPITVYVLPRNGFEGDIQVSFTDQNSGCKLQGGLIPRKKESIRMTVTLPDQPSSEYIGLKLQGRAEIGGKTIVRPVVPAEDTMQAFLYRHLVPSEELLVSVLDRKAPAMELAGESPVRISAGGQTQVVFKCARWLARSLRLELRNPPDGITLSGLKEVPAGLAFSLKADKSVEHGFADNLIIEAFRENPVKDKDGKPTGKTQLRPVGFAEAVPVQVVPAVSPQPQG
jgi:hypothetical protein